jgi:phosphoribosylpyrophosphate synthetase
MSNREKIPIILGAGAIHLKNSFEKLNYEVMISELNYDDKRKFPNSDIYTAFDGEFLERLQGKRVVIVQSANYNVINGEKWTTSDLFFETLQIIHILRNPQKVTKVSHKSFDYKALLPPSEIILVFTCMPFGKMDHAVKTGEAISAQIGMELSTSLCDKVILIDPHPPMEFTFMDKLKQGGRLEKISLVDDIRKKIYDFFDLEEAIEVTADEFGQMRMKMQSLGKVRKDSSTVEMIGEIDVSDRNVILIDDMLLTGGTLRASVKKYKELGAKEVYLGIIHALPLEQYGDERLFATYNSVNNLIISNTVGSSFFDVLKKKGMVIDCVSAIDEAIKKQ